MNKQKPMIDAAAEVDALKDSGEELVGLRRVRARVAKEPRAVVSLRLSPEELNRFTSAAAERGMTFSDFMRSAADAAVSGAIDIQQSATISEIEQKAKELAAAAGRLRAG